MSTEDLADVVLRVREKLLGHGLQVWVLAYDGRGGSGVSLYMEREPAAAMLIEWLHEYGGPNNGIRADDALNAIDRLSTETGDFHCQLGDEDYCSLILTEVHSR